MSQSGYTPIQLYYSTTASNTPSTSNLKLGELAYNIADNKVYALNAASNAIQTLVGTLGNQNASSVSITGGTISSTTLSNPTVTNYVETLYSPSAGSSFTVSLSNGTVQELSLNANGTITLPSSVAGKSYTIIVTYSGSYTLTWSGGSTLKWAGGTTPTATSTSGKYDIFNFYCDGTNTYGSVYGLNF